MTLRDEMVSQIDAIDRDKSRVDDGDKSDVELGKILLSNRHIYIYMSISYDTFTFSNLHILTL
jgi:hypothetical protein